MSRTTNYIMAVYDVWFLSIMKMPCIFRILEIFDFHYVRNFSLVKIILAFQPLTTD